MPEDDKNLVEAIEDGRIVRVSSEYAKREGLLVIRKPEQSVLDSPAVQKQMKLTPRLRGERKAYFDIDKYRRPWHDKNEIISSLVENFHWIVGSRRKQMNLNRKQLAQAINSPEEDIKMIENGIIPHNDYILINKLESYLKVNLRRAGSSTDTSSGFTARKHSLSQPKWTERMGASKPGTKAEELVDVIDVSNDDSEESK